MHRSIRNARFVCITLPAALLLGACTAWAPAPNVSPSAGVITGPVRITRHDRFSIVAEDVSVRNDSVVGHLAGHDDRLFAVALTDVKRTETQVVEPIRSLGVLVLGAAAAFGAYVAFAISTSYD